MNNLGKGFQSFSVCNPRLMQIIIRIFAGRQINVSMLQFRELKINLLEFSNPVPLKTPDDIERVFTDFNEDFNTF